MKLRLIAAAIAASVGALALPIAASAHTPVTGRTPAPAAKASHVTSVKITFGQAIATGLISVTKNGTKVASKTSGLNKRKTALRQTFAKALSKGRYTVTWRALSNDGHREQGFWAFTVA